MMLAPSTVQKCLRTSHLLIRNTPLMFLIHHPPTTITTQTSPLPVVWE